MGSSHISLDSLEIKSLNYIKMICFNLLLDLAPLETTCSSQSTVCQTFIILNLSTVYNYHLHWGSPDKQGLHKVNIIQSLSLLYSSSPSAPATGAKVHVNGLNYHCVHQPEHSSLQSTFLQHQIYGYSKQRSRILLLLTMTFRKFENSNLVEDD